jgi:hypothetical protein
MYKVIAEQVLRSYRRLILEKLKGTWIKGILPRRIGTFATVVAGPNHRATCFIHSAVAGSEFMIASGILARVTSRPLSRIVPSVSRPADFRTMDLIPSESFSALHLNWSSCKILKQRSESIFQCRAMVHWRGFEKDDSPSAATIKSVSIRSPPLIKTAVLSSSTPTTVHPKRRRIPLLFAALYRTS